MRSKKSNLSIGRQARGNPLPPIFNVEVRWSRGGAVDRNKRTFFPSRSESDATLKVGAGGKLLSLGVNDRQQVRFFRPNRNNLHQSWLGDAQVLK